MKKENEDLFKSIDGQSLDDQQRLAVLSDEDNNLIIAGAGSGKTLTIAAKVKYLVEKKGVNPEEILLLSYTNKTSEEMTQRIKRNLGVALEAKTFHKLGLEIIREHEERSPEVASNSSLREFLYSYLQEKILERPQAMRALIRLASYYLYIPRDPNEFSTLGERIDFNRNIRLETLEAETVRSIDQLIIANYLYLNRIDYIYEEDYPYAWEDNYGQIYRPDFYLPEYDIYLEHFRINEDYSAPWLSPIEEKRLRYSKPFTKVESKAKYPKICPDIGQY